MQAVEAKLAVMSALAPIPPAKLVARVDGACDDYLEMGVAERRILESLLPSDGPFDGGGSRHRFAAAVPGKRH
jgi:hypothetical protein